MAQRTQLDDCDHPLLRKPTPACLLANGLYGAGEALRILVNEASRIERAQHLQATPYERSAQRVDYANGYKDKTVLTRMGEVTFEVPQVRSGGFYPSALERGSRSEQAMNLVLAEMYVQGVSTRKVIAEMPAALVCAALQMAIAQRNPAQGLLVHSDRGTQYASNAHQALLKNHGLVGSMSRKGNCWDNSVMERFFLNLKMERVWQRDYANHSEAIHDVADYIVNFYNSVRLHSKLGNLSPNAFEHKSATQPTY